VLLNGRIVTVEDIMTVPTQEILSARALYTILGGDILYQS
jgi:hypothetical protein